MQYIASSSIYFPHSRHLLEWTVQQLVSPEDAMGLLQPAWAHFVVEVPYLFVKDPEELFEEVPL